MLELHLGAMGEGIDDRLRIGKGRKDQKTLIEGMMGRREQGMIFIGVGGPRGTRRSGEGSEDGALEVWELGGGEGTTSS